MVVDFEARGLAIRGELELQVTFGGVVEGAKELTGTQEGAGFWAWK